MFRPIPEHPKGARSQSLLGRAIVAALLGPCLAVSLAAVQRSAPPPDQVAPRDTIRTGDRRCLTRRPEDCLPRPLPADEPHDGLCATCHNLWKDTTLANTVRPCAGGGCHTRTTRSNAFHATLDSDVLANCTGCHAPHDAPIDEGGRQCGRCHGGAGRLVSWASRKPLAAPPRSLGFRHEDHPSVTCAACHGVGAGHATVTLANRADCRGCHHSPPVDNDCKACHDVDEVRATAFVVTRTLNIRIGSVDRPARTIPFEHANHWQTDCHACHTGTDLTTAQGADCSGCHLEHHEPTAACRTCHEGPAPGAHDANAHLRCGGAGCHTQVPPGIVPAPRTREVCLVCHRDRSEHQPQKTCSACHRLPEPEARLSARRVTGDLP